MARPRDPMLRPLPSDDEFVRAVEVLCARRRERDLPASASAEEVARHLRVQGAAKGRMSPALRAAARLGRLVASGRIVAEVDETERRYRYSA